YPTATRHVPIVEPLIASTPVTWLPNGHRGAGSGPRNSKTRVRRVARFRSLDAGSRVVWGCGARLLVVRRLSATVRDGWDGFGSAPPDIAATRPNVTVSVGWWQVGRGGGGRTRRVRRSSWWLRGRRVRRSGRRRGRLGRDRVFALGRRRRRGSCPRRPARRW